MHNDDKLNIEEMNRLMHDLKLPITVVQSISETVKKLNEQEDLVSYIYMLDRNIRYMTRIIDSMRDTVNKYEDMIGEEFLSDFIGYSESIVETVKPVCDLKKIKIDFDSSVEYLELVLSWNFYERIIYNIIQNSVKHAKNCTLISFKIFVNEDFIEVEIRDNGENNTAPNNKDDEPSEKVEASGEGLFIITSLVKKIDSKMEHYLCDEGMYFKLTIPILEANTTKQLDIVD